MITSADYVNSLKPYIPGKPVKELERELGISNSIKLASNENPLGPSPSAIREIKNNLYEISRYPDGSGFYLKSALSEVLNIEKDRIIIGNGSNELIDIAVRTFMKSGDEGIMGDPSFVVYKMVVAGSGSKAVTVPLKNQTHDLESMVERITDKTKVIFIANPNNPTGTIVKSEEFDRFMNNVPENILVVMDEAYYEYVTDSAYPDSFRYLHEGKDILILRTFSKIYGLAGLRIGYGIANKEIIEQMNKIREPFNTNSIAQAAALGALKDIKHVNKSLRINEGGKDYLYEQYRRMGIEFTKTEANFIFLDLKNNAQDVYNRLLSKGVIIRPISETTLRVTIGLPNENKKYIELLEEVLDGYYST